MSTLAMDDPGLLPEPQPETQPDPQAPPPAERNRLAALLRWVGAGSVALSAVIFLLQGISDVEGALRTWGCLGLMGLLAASGVGTRSLTDDAKSVRLLLGLAAALIPIQFAQVAGMLHALTTTDTTALTSFFAYDQVTGGQLLLVGLATLVACAPIAAFAFSVLVRPDAKVLTGLLLAPAAMLVLPLRDGVPGFLLVAAMGGLALYSDRLLRRRSPRYRTREGLAVRGMLALPLLIACGRYAFHVDSVAGGCALLGLSGVAFAWAGRNYAEEGFGKEMLTLTGSAMSLIAWLIWCLQGIAAASGLWVTLPSAAFLLVAGRGSQLAPIYRGLACAMMAFAGLDLIEVGDFASTFVGLGLGIATTAWGIHARERITTLTGVAVALLAAAVLATDLFGAIEVANWVVLALGGVALVVLAAFVERHGRAVSGRVRDGWVQMAEWK